MTERNVSGDAARSKYKKAQKVAEELGLTPEALEALAEGVREFDAQRSAEQRSVSALEKIATNTQPERERESQWAWEERRSRRRATYALELLAVSVMSDDPSDSEQVADLAAIRRTNTYRLLVDRLKGVDGG